MKSITIETNNVDLSLFDGDENEYKIHFDDKLDIDSAIVITDAIFDWEETNKSNKSIYVDFKRFGTDDLVKMFQHFMKRETLINNYMIVNINILINGYNTLDDALFESDVIYESDLEQLLDIKLGLEDDIKDFQTRLSTWYLAGLKSLHKVEYTYLDNMVDMPMVFNKIISSSNILTLSQVFAKSNQINTSELPLVKDAYSIVMSAVYTSAIATELLQSINSNL